MLLIIMQDDRKSIKKIYTNIDSREVFCNSYYYYAGTMTLS